MVNEIEIMCYSMCVETGAQNTNYENIQTDTDEVDGGEEWTEKITEHSTE